MSDMSSGFQMNAEQTWWESPDGAPPSSPQPIYRNGGPRDGDRLGTMFPTAGGGWEMALGLDESHQPLPGWVGDL